MPSEWIIDAEQAGLRLAQALARLSGLSRKEAAVAIASRRVRLGRDICRIQAKLVRAGQKLRLEDVACDRAAPPPVPKFAEAPLASDDFSSLRILALTRELVVVDKPAGLLSEEDRFGAPSVQSLLPGVLRARNERDPIWLVHRLDAGTSGVLVLARTAAAARCLFAAFRERRVHKNYLALVPGTSEPLAGVVPLDDGQGFASLVTRGRTRIDAALCRAQGTRQSVAAPGDADGKPAQSHVELVDSNPRGRCVHIKPITGRSHQIRVHLAHIGLPILGDALYRGARYVDGPAGTRLAVGRTMLHARAIRIPDPRVDPNAGTQAPLLQFEAPVPNDFQQVAVALGLQFRIQPAPCRTPRKSPAAKNASR